MATGLDNLKIYKMAEDLEVRVHQLTNGFPKDERFRSVDQLKRSASSVTNNIAEGYNKQSLKEKIHIFNDIVKGEAEETKRNLAVCIRKEFHKDAKIVEDYTELIKAISGYTKFLRGQNLKLTTNN